MDSLKVLTYNILSQRNFKTTIDRLTKELASGIDNNNTNMILDSFYKFDRMSSIKDLFKERSPDLILLQECDSNELENLKESLFIRSTYYICSDRHRSGCVILSRLKPLWCKVLYFDHNDTVGKSKAGTKAAIFIKVKIRTKSLTQSEDLLLVNLHLSSNLANNCVEKRSAQIKLIGSYLNSPEQRSKYDFNAKYSIVGGDFNFDGKTNRLPSLSNENESVLLSIFVYNGGFVDLLKTATVNGDQINKSFDPLSNFTASIIASWLEPRNLDRLLFKITSNEKNDLSMDPNDVENLIETICLVNTKPLKLSKIFNSNEKCAFLHEPYLQINKIFQKNSVTLYNKNATEQGEVNLWKTMEDSSNDIYLNPSDHYGLEFQLKMPHSLHKNRQSFKNTLALVIESKDTIIVDEIRKENDAMYTRWPAHINLLYPFYDSNEYFDSLKYDESGSLIGDIMNCLKDHEPFKMNFDVKQLRTFSDSRVKSVIFIEPDDSSIEKIKLIYESLINLFTSQLNGSVAWRNEIKPHLTIAQEANKRSLAKDWSTTTINKIQTELKRLILSSNDYRAEFSINVDTVYWMSRDDNESSFKLKYNFPLGIRYPPIDLDSRLKINSNSNNQSFIMTNKDLFFVSSDKTIFINRILNLLFDIICKTINFCDCTIINKFASKFIVEFKSNNNNSIKTIILWPFGSYLNGINLNDIDLTIIICNKDDDKYKNEFIKNFTSTLRFEMCQDNSNTFHTVRNIEDAIVPIVEVCLTSNSVNLQSIDIQIYDFDYNCINDVRELNKYYYNSSMSLMKSIEIMLDYNYNKLFAISGIFESFSIRLFVRNYKDYQILISFVKHWAKMRCIYGKFKLFSL
jgi:endonuclease/exonuclease/phosphatase family metal-dependent hydrolase